MPADTTRLVEEAFPFPAASVAAAREKTLRAGHPSTLHPWAGRRPLGLCRAILHAQFSPAPEHVADRILALKRTAALADCETGGDYGPVKAARKDFGGGRKPRVVDPFCGSGAIPMQARVLGLDAMAGDLNPLAALLAEAVAGIPARFDGGAGKHALLVALAAAKEAYAKELTEADWIEMTSERLRGRPDLAELAGCTFPVVARLWVRTVRSPSPAFADAHVPLLPSFVLSTAPGRETCVRPVVEGRNWRFEVRKERPGEDDDKGLRYAKRGLFRCLLSGQPIPKEHIRAEIASHRNGRRLLATVVQGFAGRIYLAPTPEDEERERLWEAIPVEPLLPVATDNPNLIGPEWGFTRWGQFFDHKPFGHIWNLATHIRVARAAALEKVPVIREHLGVSADDHRGYAEGGRGPEAIADAAALYCALAMSRTIDRATTLCTWDSSARSEGIHGTFQHHKTNMAWCYAEGLLGGEGTGSFRGSLDFVWKAVESIPVAEKGGTVEIRTGTPARQKLPKSGVVATDPPGLAEASHADTTDFHYPFLRAALRDLFPDLFRTMAAPKLDELSLHPDLHGGAVGARAFVLDGLEKEFRRLAGIQNPRYPATLLYTLTESDSKEVAETPADLVEWLGRLLSAGWDVRAAWPLRLDRATAQRASPSALLVVCRKAQPRKRTLPRNDLAEAVRGLASEAEDALSVCAPGSEVRPQDAALAAFGRALRALAGLTAVLRADGTAMSAAEAAADVWRTVVSTRRR